jgi:hypothetical protein
LKNSRLLHLYADLKQWAEANCYDFAPIKIKSNKPQDFWSHPRDPDYLKRYEDCFSNGLGVSRAEDFRVIYWPFGDFDFNFHTRIGRHGSVLTNIYQSKYFSLLRSSFVDSVDHEKGVISLNLPPDEEEIATNGVLAGGATNYTHFIVDVLPHAILADRFLNKQVIFIGLNEVQKSILDYLGISNYVNIPRPKSAKIFRFKSAYVTSRPPLSILKDYCDSIFQEFGHLRGHRDFRNIYLHKSTGKARIVFERQLIQSLSSKGVSIVDVLKTPFPTLLSYLSQCENLIIPSGGSMGNFYFAPAAAKTLLVNNQHLHDSDPMSMDTFVAITPLHDLNVFSGCQLDWSRRPPWNKKYYISSALLAQSVLGQ